MSGLELFLCGVAVGVLLSLVAAKAGGWFGGRRGDVYRPRAFDGDLKPPSGGTGASQP